MRTLISLVLAITLPLSAFAGSLSGEARIPTTVKKPTPKIEYFTGKNGGCYTLVKSKKTGKLVKKYVDRKYCKKK